MENDSFIANHQLSKSQPLLSPRSLPDDLLSNLSESIRVEIMRWDDGRLGEIEELQNRTNQMEKTMKWWSDCTANWREKWGKVRNERNKCRDLCKSLQSQLDAALKDNSTLRLEKGELKEEYARELAELAHLKDLPLTALEPKRNSRKSSDYGELYSSYIASEEQGSEPSLQSELHFIEDILKSTEHVGPNSRSPSAGSEALPSLNRAHLTGPWRNDERVDRRHSDTRSDDRMGGLDLTKLKHLLEQTQHSLHEEKSSKLALAQSADLYNRENATLKKKLDDYKRQRSEALEEVSRIQLESGDKLARLSLEIEGENETRNDLERKMKDMRADIQRLQAENATEWARRERIETEKSSLERENKNLKLQLQEAEDTISRRNINPLVSPEYKTLQTDLYERNKELEMLKTSHTRVKKLLAEKTGELNHCQKRLEVVEEEVYSLRKRVEDLKKELVQREDEVDMKNNQIRKLQRSADEGMDQNDTLQNQINALETRLRQRTDAMFNPTQRRQADVALSNDEESGED